MNRLLSNKKTPIIPPVLVNGKLVSNFEQKANFSTTILLLNVLLLKMVPNYQTLVIKLKKILTSFDIKDDDIPPIIKI